MVTSTDGRCYNGLSLIHSFYCVNKSVSQSTFFETLRLTEKREKGYYGTNMFHKIFTAGLLKAFCMFMHNVRFRWYTAVRVPTSLELYLV